MTRKEKDEMAAKVLKAYQKGFRHALQNFAYWESDSLHIGPTGIKLREAVNNMEKLTNYNPPRI